MTREGLERQSRNEAQRVGGHHHMHVAALLGQQTREVRRLVSGDGTRDTQNNVSRSLHEGVILSRFSLYAQALGSMRLQTTNVQFDTMRKACRQANLF